MSLIHLPNRNTWYWLHPLDSSDAGVRFPLSSLTKGRELPSFCFTYSVWTPWIIWSTVEDTQVLSVKMYGKRHWLQVAELFATEQFEQLAILVLQAMQVLFWRTYPHWHVLHVVLVKQIEQPIWTLLQTLHWTEPLYTTKKWLDVQVLQKLSFWHVAQVDGQGWQRLLASLHWLLIHYPCAERRPTKQARMKSCHSLDVINLK